MAAMVALDKEYHKESKSNGSSTYERDVTIGYERCNE